MFGELFPTHGEIAVSHCLQYRHHALLVALSYLVAAFAAYTAFHLIERVRLLKTWGCCTIQGDYFARPPALPEMSAMLRIGKITPLQGDCRCSSMGAVSTFEESVLRS
jgi:hypothetical protein